MIYVYPILTKYSIFIWTASSEFGTYRICEQRRFRRACASAQSRQNLRCSLIQALSQEEPSDRKPDLWPLWMAGHAQLKFVMTECSKTQNRLTRLILLALLTSRLISLSVWRLISTKLAICRVWQATNGCKSIWGAAQQNDMRTQRRQISLHICTVSRVLAVCSMGS